MTNATININAEPSTPEQFEYIELDHTEMNGASALPRETALAISYNGISQAVMMVSPGNFEDFIRGFSLTSDVVHSLDEIYDIQVTESGDSHRAEVAISSRAFWALKRSRRQLAGTSGCGICGTDAIDQALPQLTGLTHTPIPNADLFGDLRNRISVAQQVGRHSGALHAALYIDTKGHVRLCREDIGRHNALDKLIGAMINAGQNPRDGFVVVTSRCSLELIHKAVRAQIGTLVSLSAPTALTVQWARRYGLNLIHVPHHSAPRVYSPAPG
ncbi:formate dehydrogenase accessory sulfurtransferase FdhD [Marinobacter sp. HN1S83]|uniref:formate dehydrogenase accessory sulfurtransferase FdhD n=1 Tax=Marinobacter sp. HN1S83 TaxID=3382301 RepID=UPI00387A96C9